MKFPQGFDEVHRSALIAGTISLFVWGEIVYTDIFDCVQTSSFRLSFTGRPDAPRVELTAMEEGNDAT